MTRTSLLAFLALLACLAQSNTPARAGAVGAMHSRPVKAGVAPSPGIHTIVAGGNVADVARDIQAWHDEQHPDCRFVRVVAADMLEQESKYTTEKWTIEACATQEFAYKVFLMPDDKVLVDAVLNLETPP